MKNISRKDWDNYITRLSKLSRKAADTMTDYVNKHGLSDRKGIIDLAYALATKYGEGSSELACEMYDAIAEASGVSVPDAEPAETATYGETAKAVNGSLKQSPTGQLLSQVADRLVKQAAADTTLRNARRDGAEWAWIPNGDTCSFCLTLASRGWQPASRAVLKGDHAEHIHANCDCEFAIRFDSRMSVAGYDPDKLLEQYQSADGSTPGEKINSMRRMRYASHKEEINAQKRAAYAMGQQRQGVNIWPQGNEVSKEEKRELLEYANEHGVHAVDFSRFDGDPELFRKQIDELSTLQEEVPTKRGVTLSVEDLPDEDFAQTRNRTIYLSKKVLRNREATEKNIGADGYFAAKSEEDIVAHEYGHILESQLGVRGIDIAKEAYYTVYGRELLDKEANDFLVKNISQYSAEADGHELLSEIMAKNNSSPTDFTRACLEILKKKARK